MIHPKLCTAALAAATALAFTASVSLAQHDHSHAHGHGHNEPSAGAATIKSEILPNDNYAAGKTATAIVRLTGPGGKPVTLDDLTVAHTEKLHLLIVDESLTDYHHEHPVPAEKPGEYRFEFTPRFGGTYHVWSDLLPVGTGTQEYSKTRLKVSGTPGKPQNTTNITAEVDGYRFDWSSEEKKPLRVGESAVVKVRVTSPGGEPFKGLEPVMGAYAHMVAFPKDLEGVMHVHPAGPEPTANTERGGPELSFHVVPEKAGYHKFYLQTQIGGKDKFAAFGVEVAPAAANAGGNDVVYTCPMHPEVRQKGPGKCPKCGGMALVPEKASANPKAHDHAHDH